MPPVAKAGGDTFRKDVEFTLKEDDDDEQIAAGIVMVPDKVDLQQDFAREETIREFASQFETFLQEGEADGGIMHAAWPSDWMELERNEVLDEPETIGGQEVAAGSWVQEWRFNDEGLWGLVADGIIAGYSIGAIQVKWGGPYDQDEIDDVAVPDEIADEAPVWELVSAIIREVSAVDIPAVPDAQILETKADAEKRLGDYLGDPNGFVEEAMERGHSEEEAERLWEELNRAIEVDGSADPGEKSLFERVGKAVLSPFRGDDADTDREKATTSDADSGTSGSTSKEGRTLSQGNRDALFASIDAQLGVLEDAGIDHGATRFTDRDDVDFDIADFDGKAAPTDKDATGGDTPDDGGKDAADTNTMTNDDPFDDAPEWAKAMHDDVQENSKQIDDLSQKVNKGDPDDPEKAWEDAPAWAKQLREEQEKNRERVDSLAEASGKSQQLEGGSGDNGGEGSTKADILGLPGGDA